MPPSQFATFLSNHDQTRVISQLGGSPQEAMLAASLLLTAPGAPFLYYGEEIGMLGQKPNVENETGDPASILSHYRDLILIRSQHAALRVGDLSVLTTGNNALYGILRVSQQEALLVLVNLSGSPVSSYALSAAQSSLAEGSYMPYPILGEGDFAPLTTGASGGFSAYIPLPEVPPYATIILQLNAP